MIKSKWFVFWQRKNYFDRYMQFNYDYFFTKSEKYIALNKSYAVLDFGSGPGYLADAWHNKVALIHGIDISERYNNIAKSKHANREHVQFFWLNPNNYLDLSLLSNSFYDVIIVMSVLQYYKSEEDIIQMLEQLVKKVKPGGKILLGDLIVQSNMLKDAISILSQAIKMNKLFSILWLLIKLRFSYYYTIKKQIGLLIIPLNNWCALLSKLNLTFEVINEPITLQKERKSIIITV